MRGGGLGLSVERDGELVLLVGAGDIGVGLLQAGRRTASLEMLMEMRTPPASMGLVWRK